LGWPCSPDGPSTLAIRARDSVPYSSPRCCERLWPPEKGLQPGPVVVDAPDEATARFYVHHGFVEVPEHPLHLYRGMKDIRASQSWIPM
jgi:hypothetical protein